MAKSRKQNDRQTANEKKTKPKTSGRKPVKQRTGKFEQVVFRDWCKACGICSAFCPKHVLGRDDTGAPVIEHPEDCIGCRFCELHCPDFAITINDREEKKQNGEDQK